MVSNNYMTSNCYLTNSSMMEPYHLQNNFLPCKYTIIINKENKTQTTW